MFLLQIFRNQLLVNALLGWFFAQFIKMIIFSVQQGRLCLSRMRGDGGMPSCHSATVTSLAISAAIKYGLDSPWFALSAVFAIIVMHDAMGVRAEAGKHAKLLNMFLRARGPHDLKDTFKEGEMMKEFLGHTPMQVFVGAIVGFCVACIFSFTVWN